MKKKITIAEFAEEIRERLMKKIEDMAGIEINTVLKNNSVKLTALVFRDKRSNLSPTIYLNHFYLLHVEYGMELDVIVEQIRDSYDKSRVKQPMDFSFFHDWEQVKPMIAYKLINREKNQELLQKIPYKEVLDLAMVFYLSLKQGEGTILIYNSHCAMWGIGLEELSAVAEANTPQICPMSFKSMEDIVKDMVEEKVVGADMEAPREIDMYILSNKAHVLGAAAMLYPDSMEKVAEYLQADFYILPCSLHEVIILPDKEENEPEKLAKMVHEVNETDVDAEEVLGDRVYIYKRAQKEICIAA